LKTETKKTEGSGFTTYFLITLGNVRAADERRGVNIIEEKRGQAGKGVDFFSPGGKKGEKSAKTREKVEKRGKECFSRKGPPITKRRGNGCVE